MQNYGFIKVAAAIPALKVAACAYNAQEMEKLIRQAAGAGVRVVVFPELSLTGYTCGDLFLQPALIRAAEAALADLLQRTAAEDIVFIAGCPVAAGSALLNAAVVCYQGKICGVVPKTCLPNYKEFYEKRWFVSAEDWQGGEVTLCGQRVRAGADLLFQASGAVFGVEVCEDLWSCIPPSSQAALQGAEIIFNLSASDSLAGKSRYLRSLVAQQSARGLCAYVYTSGGFGESSTDLTFGGNALIYEDGAFLAEARRYSLEPQLIVSEIDVEALRTERRANTTFATDSAHATLEPYEVVDCGQAPAAGVALMRPVSRTPFIAQGAQLDENCQEVLEIQSLGLAKRLAHTGAKKAVIGVSGGLDSTLALLVCVRAFDKLGLSRSGIIGVTMPGFGTTGRTYQNALALMNALKITVREISIKEACLQHFKDISHPADTHDITYENAQARERTQVLMDVANQTGGLVIGTGDLSELALGWATYNGDQMSMYGVNASVPKTLVKHLVKWVAAQEEESVRKLLLDIADTPISPELLPADSAGKISQKTEDLVGPYELHDFYLYHFLRRGFSPAKIYFLACYAFRGEYAPEVIKKWLVTFIRRFFAQQFKRSCMPDGPKVGSVSLSPRGDWRMPSDACSQVWLQEAENL